MSKVRMRIMVAAAGLEAHTGAARAFAAVSTAPPCRRQKYCRRGPPDLLALAAQLVTNHPAIAVIDGNLCRLNRAGAIVARHPPLATAVLEFRPGPMRLYVREHPFGLLPGVPNLYCLAGDFRLVWVAEWPLPDDPCGRIVDASGDSLVVESTRGVTVRLDPATGRVRDCAAPMAAAG